MNETAEKKIVTNDMSVMRTMKGKILDEEEEARKGKGS